MHKFIAILLIVTLLIPTLVIAQDGDEIPLYIECGAEDYLVQYYYFAQPTQVALEAYATAVNNLEYPVKEMLDAYLALAEVRDYLYAMDVNELPSCLLQLHNTQIAIITRGLDVFALLLGSYALIVDADDYFTQVSVLNEEIQNMMTEREALHFELGWHDENGDFTNEPPPLEETE